MVIWKDDMPFIVKEVADLRQIIDDEVFEAVEKFIEEYVDDSDEVAELNREISSLDDEITVLEDECSDLVRTIEELKEKYSEQKEILPVIKDFIDVMDDLKMNKDQAYYWDRLKDAVESL